MDDLIARLESAPEGSRVFDCEIAKTQGWKFEKVSQHWEQAWITPEGIQGFPPFYTTSLDAALTLVPEGNDWDVGHIHKNGHCNGYVMRENKDNYYVMETGCAATPALALCIAAMKARA